MSLTPRNPTCPKCGRDMTNQCWYGEAMRGSQTQRRAVCYQCVYPSIASVGTWSEEYKALKDDARRYQYLKTAERGALYWPDGWLDVENSDEWDEFIDSALA